MRAMDDASGDDAGGGGMDNGQDDEDASEQEDMVGDSRASLSRPGGSNNIDDELLQDPLRNDDNAQVNQHLVYCFVCDWEGVVWGIGIGFICLRTSNIGCQYVSILIRT